MKRSAEIVKTAVAGVAIVTAVTLFGPVAIADLSAENSAAAVETTEVTEGSQAEEVATAPVQQTPATEVSAADVETAPTENKEAETQLNDIVAPSATTTTSVAITGTNSTSANAINTSSKAAVAQAFREGYIENDVYLSENTRDVYNTCDAGRVNPIASARIAKTWNFMRGLSGLDAVTIDPASALARYTQEAAMMQSMHLSLSHAPTSDWKCYTVAGATGSASSNLAQSTGQTPSEQLLWYMMDWSGNNKSTLTADGINDVLGHRMNLMNPELTKSSYGSVNGYNAIAVVRGAFTDYNSHQMMNANATKPTTMSWPSAGYFPTELLTSYAKDSTDVERWSFSVKGADMSSATATVRNASGRSVATRVVRNTQKVAGYGTINIKMPKIANLPTGSQVQTWTVTVSGVKGTSKSSYSYQVKLFNATDALSNGVADVTVKRAPIAVQGYVPMPAKILVGSNTAVSYQWQRSENGGAWKDITDTTTDATVAPNQLNYNPSYGSCHIGGKSQSCGFTSKAQADKYSFRLKVTNASGTTYSEPMKVIYIGYTTNLTSAKVGQSLHQELNIEGNGSWVNVGQLSNGVRVTTQWYDASSFTSKLLSSRKNYTVPSSMLGRKIQAKTRVTIGGFDRISYYYPESAQLTVG